jgi:hypothetical protein
VGFSPGGKIFLGKKKGENIRLLTPFSFADMIHDFRLQRSPGEIGKVPALLIQFDTGGIEIVFDPYFRQFFNRIQEAVQLQQQGIAHTGTLDQGNLFFCQRCKFILGSTALRALFRGLFAFMDIVAD